MTLNSLNKTGGFSFVYLVKPLDSTTELSDIESGRGRPLYALKKLRIQMHEQEEVLDMILQHLTGTPLARPFGESCHITASFRPIRMLSSWWMEI